MAIGDDAIAAGMAIVAGTAQANTIDTEINRSRDYIAQRTSAVTPITKGGTGATTAAAARTNLGCAAASHAHTWSQITGIPATFAPSSHTHPWDQVTGKPSTYPTTWAQVSGRPELASADLAKPNAVPVYNGNNQLTTATPSLGGHAASKAYCDQKLGAGGGTITGTLYMPHLAVVTSSYRAMYQNGDGRVGVTPSARRYKKDIKPKAYTLSDAIALEVVNYRLRADVFGSADAPLEVGVIAEQLIDAGLSEYVVFGGDGQPESVAYERLALVALGALRDVAAQLTAHEERLATIEELLIGLGHS